MPTRTPPLFRVDIPLLRESAVGNALQVIDLLRSANLLARLRLGASAPRMAWRWLDAEGLPLTGWPSPLAAYAPAPTEVHEGPAQAMLIPSVHAADIPAIRAILARHPALVRQIGVALDGGQKLLTVGNGAWLAAQSGRLAGRQACLPWFYTAGFSQDFPALRVAPNQDWTDDGPWLSCALPHSLVDLAVALVGHAWGPELAHACSAAMQPDHPRTRAALQANAQAHIPATLDSTLARAIAWMEAHLDEPYSLPRVAEAAAVSPRTLLRHFQQELSRTPLDHLHGLRCERARVLLEVTLESVPSIAQACGYADPAAFRRIFVRHTGSTPTDYRQRHALRAPRRRWGVDLGG